MKYLITILITLVTLSANEVYATFDVQAQQSANLAFDTSGIVNKVFVDVDSVVKQNQPLVNLQNDNYKANLDIAKTTFEYAKKDLNRQEKVKTIIDKEKYDKYKLAYENAKNNLALQQAMFDKTILKAPFDGVIFSKEVESGDVVSSAMIRTILKIQSAHERKLVLEFDQKYWSNIKVGDTFKYKVDGDNNEYQGKISKIYPIANENRKIKAEVIAKDFVVGLFGSGYIITQDNK